MKLINKFIDYANTFEKYSENTLIAYQTTYKQFTNYLGSKDLLDVDMEDVEGFISELKQNNGGNLKKSTINLKLGALKALYTFLVNRDYIDKDPTKTIDRQSPPKKIKDVLTRREVNSLISAVDSIRDKGIIGLLFVSGMRISELLKLDKDNVEDIYEDEKLKGVKVHIEDAKNYKDRKIYCSEKYYKYTRWYLEQREDNQKTLYLSQQGNRPTSNTVRNILSKAAKKANIEKNVTPHCLRRSCATYLYNKARLSPSEIQKHLGHSSIETTLKNYIKVYDDSRKEKNLNAFN